MRIVKYTDIVNQVAEACKSVNFHLGMDVWKAIEHSAQKEESTLGKTILEQLMENADYAQNSKTPLCQDTGTAVFFVEVGDGCQLDEGTLREAINEGVEKGYADGFLRSSMLHNPITREKSAGYNTPAIIHFDLVKGDKIKMHFSAKGGGAENMSALKMLKPSDGLAGVKAFILDVVKQAGPNACPPLIVGVGIGGNFEYAAILAKRSLMRTIGERHLDTQVAALELELLEEINQLDIGPQGLGGNTTALDVKIEVLGCHIASLPVAVNLNCHSSRHTVIEI